MLRWVRPFAAWIRLHPRLASRVLRAVPDWPTTVRFPHLGAFRIRVRRNRAFWLRDPEEFERTAFRALQVLVRSGDVVADIGANLGLYSRFAAGWTPAGKVLAFEPWRENCANLGANLELGGVARKVAVLPYALADLEGEAEFQVDDMQSASGALDRVRGGAPSEGRALAHLPPRTEVVACRTLDGLVAAGEIPVPDVIKIDVEGAEGLVLRGASKLLAGRRPRLLVELHGAEIAREVLELLLESGYQVVGWGAGAWQDVRPTALTIADLPRITGRYDVHFIAASADGGLPTAEALSQPPFAPENRRHGR